jgi:peptidoglycan hydrolase-like protein with peptidoglycan-binding domain
MPTYHIVQKGDTLSKIADEHYGDESLWTEIHEANTNLIKDPDLIQVGWKLVIPDLDDEESDAEEEEEEEEEELPQLARGSSNPAVKELQKALIEAGYGIKADGVFGAKTEEAVREFQSDNDLDVDGIVGPDTWAALDF